MISKGAEPHCTIIAKGEIRFADWQAGEDERMPRNDEMDATFDIVNLGESDHVKLGARKIRWTVSIAI